MQKLRHDKEVAYQRTLNKITINKEKAQLRRAENRQTAKQLLQNEVNTGINASCSTAGMSSSLTKARRSSAKRRLSAADTDVNATAGMSSSLTRARHSSAKRQRGAVDTDVNETTAGSLTKARRSSAKWRLSAADTDVNATAGMSSSLTKALHSSAKRQQGTVNSDSDVNATTGLSESGQGYKTCTCLTP